MFKVVIDLVLFKEFNLIVDGFEDLLFFESFLLVVLLDIDVLNLFENYLKFVCDLSLVLIEVLESDYSVYVFVLVEWVEWNCVN